MYAKMERIYMFGCDVSVVCLCELKACVNGHIYVVMIHGIWIYVNVHIGMYTYIMMMWYTYAIYERI